RAGGSLPTLKVIQVPSPTRGIASPEDGIGWGDGAACAAASPPAASAAHCSSVRRFIRPGEHGHPAGRTPEPPMLRTTLLRCLLVLCALGPAALRADDALWSLLRAGGQVVLLRHDKTDPGVGDPPGMKLDDCATQRNLSDEGRAHARRLGEE